MMRKAIALGIVSSILFFSIECISNYWLGIRILINFQFLIIAFSYIIFGLVFGMIAFGTKKILDRRSRRKLDTESYCLTFLISVNFFLYAFTWVNRRLPSALFSPLGLSINIGLMFIFLPLSFIIYFSFRFLNKKYPHVFLPVPFLIFFYFDLIFLPMFNYEKWQNSVFRLTKFWTPGLFISNFVIIFVVLLFSISIYIFLKWAMTLRRYFSSVAFIALRNTFLVFIFLFCLFLVFLRPRSRPQVDIIVNSAGMYNVVLILADAMRADHISSFGYPRPTTPNLDRLTEESIVLKKCFTQHPSTGPTLLTLFTSRYFTYPYEGKKEFISLAETASPRFIEILNKYGYQTAAFAAYNISSKLMRKYNFGYYYIDPHYIYGSFFITGLFGNAVEWFKGITYLNVLLQENMINDFFRWLQLNKEKRFLAYIHLVYSHSPYKTPDSYQELFYKGNKKEKQELAVEWQEKQNKIDPLKISKIIDMYDDSVRCTDEKVGGILDFLKRSGFYENTIIVVFADHGEAFLEHNDSHHGRSLFEENIHIPLIIYVPGFKPRTTSQLVGNIDIMPTVMDLIGIEYPRERCDGLSLTPLLEGKGPNRPFREYIFSQRTGYFTGIRTEKWKLIFCEKGREKFLGTTKLAHKQMRELYNLAVDPAELENIYLKEKDNPEIGRLVELLEKQIEYQKQLSRNLKTYDDGQ